MRACTRSAARSRSTTSAPASAPSSTSSTCPSAYLKIDGDFIRGLPGSRTDQLVVKALVGVVRGMGRRTIAEFVGDAPTLSMLRSYGVDYAQGFEVGRPQPLTAPAAA